MQKVSEALADWVPPGRPIYDQSLYPHRYAIDFLIGVGCSVIPEEIRYRIDREVMSKPNVKGKQRKRRYPEAFMARLMLNAWLKETGEDEDTAYRALADKHLDVNGIVQP
ncbi:hypothetical protein GCM10011578_044010 [Streptomyces fuscichromogenes]|uniref:Uncharacterized protein n=2 Tax=Streptomyces fuscichromogenes TaxID=1324013 RepID=A0A917XEF7_9ACTN|nr:hypothetical protein GCM10011578_044010 [Streptomyces fuscichromogenes]